MQEPLRSRTMQAIASQLGTITEGVVVYPNKTLTYWSTPSLITRSLFGILQYDQPLAVGSPTTQLDLGPVLGVVRSSGSLYERNIHVSDDAPMDDAFWHFQRVSIIGYVKGTPVLLAIDALERLWQDVKECLYVDRTFGGVALDSRPEGPLDTDDGETEPLAVFRQDILVTA